MFCLLPADERDDAATDQDRIRQIRPELLNPKAPIAEDTRSRWCSLGPYVT